MLLDSVPDTVLDSVLGSLFDRQADCPVDPRDDCLIDLLFDLRVDTVLDSVLGSLLDSAPHSVPGRLLGIAELGKLVEDGLGAYSEIQYLYIVMNLVNNQSTSVQIGVIQCCCRMNSRVFQILSPVLVHVV